MSQQNLFTEPKEELSRHQSPEIGVPFTHDGLTLVAQESYFCYGCYFHDKVTDCADLPRCNEIERNDSKRVIFVKVKP